MKSHAKYLIAAITAYFLWGFFSFGLKPIAHYPSMDILYYRLFASTLLLGVGIGIFRRKKLNEDIKLLKDLAPKYRKQQLILLFGGTFLLLTNWLSFIYIINHVSVKAASLAYLICPIVTTLLSAFILREYIRKEKWLAIAISGIGCLFLAYGALVDVAFSLLVATTYALYLIIQKQLNKLDSLNLLLFQLIIMSICLLPFYVFNGGGLPQESIFYECLTAIIILFTITPMFLSTYALRGLPSSMVGILIYINPIINFLLALFYYKESITIYQIIAYCLIFVSIIIFNSKFLPSKPNKTNQLI